MGLDRVDGHPLKVHRSDTRNVLQVALNKRPAGRLKMFDTFG